MSALLRGLQRILHSARQGHLFTRRSAVTALCLAVTWWCGSALGANLSTENNQTPPCGDSNAPSVVCSSAVSASFDTQGRLWLAYVVDDYLWLSMRPHAEAEFLPPRRVNGVAEKISARGENRPQLAVDGDYVMLSWARPGSQRFTADIRYSFSQDGGHHFTPPRSVNRDTLGDEPSIGHSFVRMHYRKPGQLQLFWLDGRERAAAQAQGESFQGSSLFYAESTDYGEHFSSERSLSPHTCECCRLALAADEQRTWLLWREIDTNSGARDHALAVLAGNELSQQQRFSHENWVVDACPHHGPDLDLQDLSADVDEAASGAESDTRRLHAVWFSAAQAEANLWYRNQLIRAPSDTLDSAETDAPADFATAFGNAQHQAAHPQIQSVGAQLIRSWQEFDGAETQILTQYSLDGGAHWSGPQVQLSSAGAADYGFLLSDGRDIYLSWLSAAEGYRLQRLTPLPAAVSDSARSVP